MKLPDRIWVTRIPYPDWQLDCPIHNELTGNHVPYLKSKPVREHAEEMLDEIKMLMFNMQCSSYISGSHYLGLTGRLSSILATIEAEEKEVTR